MKQQNIATLILIISVSLAVSYFIASRVMKSPEGRTAEVEIARPIDPTFPSPNEQPLSAEANSIYKKIFTPDAVNPTESIQIGSTTTDQPFTNESN